MCVCVTTVYRCYVLYATTRRVRIVVMDNAMVTGFKLSISMWPRPRSKRPKLISPTNQRFDVGGRVRCASLAAQCNLTTNFILLTRNAIGWTGTKGN